MTPMTGNNIIYKPKLSEDIKAVPEEPVHAQVYMMMKVYGHIPDEDRKKNAKMSEQVFYKKENLNSDISQPGEKKKIGLPDGVDAEALMKLLNNPEMAALLAKGIKG